MQIDKLASRVEALAGRLNPTKIKYVVYMRFDGETDDKFYARYPDYPRDPERRRRVLKLSFE